MENIVFDYMSGIDELNVILRASYLLAGGNAEKAADDMLSALIKAYANGTAAASQMLGADIAIDLDDMEEAIYCLVDGKTFADRTAAHIRNNDWSSFQALAQSEYHRVYNAAVYNGGLCFDEVEITKTWQTVGDDKVRETHDYINGQRLPLHAEFFTFDGDRARYPGDFARAENNVGCRCILRLSW